MDLGGVLASLSLLLFLGAVKGNEGGVSFWRTDFTMTCPGSGKWYQGEALMEGEEKEIQVLPYNEKNKGHYRCDYLSHNSETSYHFYAKGKVCDNCFEVDGVTVVVVLLVDLLLTAGVGLLVYVRVTKGRAPHDPRAPRAPGAPSSEYETLAQNRSETLYAGVPRR